MLQSSGIIEVWIDGVERSAAGQMAVDEALLQISSRDGVARLRCYRWREAAVTVGYFQTLPERSGVPMIRRITGGGTVNHGEDVTLCLVAPRSWPLVDLVQEERYRIVHTALQSALEAEGYPLRPTQAADTFRQGPCFSHPVTWDLLDAAGVKRVGGAQRRNRSGLIHQGSLLLPDFLRQGGERFEAWVRAFVYQLGKSRPMAAEPTISDIEAMALELEREKYATERWNYGKKL